MREFIENIIITAGRKAEIGRSLRNFKTRMRTGEKHEAGYEKDYFDAINGARKFLPEDLLKKYQKRYDQIRTSNGEENETKI